MRRPLFVARRTSLPALLAALALATLLSSSGCHKKTQLTDVVDGKFKVGQRWNYWARPGEEQSTFVVEKIESHPTLGVVMHVGLDDLILKNGKTTQGLLLHLVLTRDALAESAAKVLEETAPLPPFQPAYEAWKKQVDDTGTAPVISKTLANYLNSLDQAP